jgi:hypothetical protein
MKKAGTFFKSVISKGKTFLKRKKARILKIIPIPGSILKEDQDIIEVGKSTNHMMPSSMY